MYRLRGVVIEVPPLRARPDDIPALLSVFAKEFGIESPLDWVSDDALAVLQSYQWPKNGRELKQVVHDLSQRVRDRMLTVEDLGPRFLGAAALD